MKKLLTILFLFACLEIHATTYYVGGGTDGAGHTGAVGDPWATLAYACTRVTMEGDVIYVNVGTCTETVQSILAEGVSITGAGNTSIIHSHYVSGDQPTIKLYSAAEGINGNQSISYIRMDGDALTAYSAISVGARSNVSVHHCEFANFSTEGVIFSGLVIGNGDPVTPATGNKFYNNIITNCADFVGAGSGGDGRGNLNIGGQTGMLVYNNTITQTDRGADSNGYGIKFYGNGYNRGLKIYNNNITVPPWDESSWDFAIELINCRGGVEIYNNIIQGNVDFGFEPGVDPSTNDDSGYGFAAKVYNNTIGQPILQNHYEIGISLERNISGGFYIYNNLFKNLFHSIGFGQVATNTVDDVYIYYNIFVGIGMTSTTGGAAISIGDYSPIAAVYDNINIVNNVMYCGVDGGEATIYMIEIRLTGTVDNLTIRNNIIRGFGGISIYLRDGTYNVVSIENNNFYGNGYDAPSNLPDIDNGGISITNLTNQNNIVTDPGFVTPGTDFHLQSISPARDAGLNVGLTRDYSGHSIPQGAGYDIGAYEYGTWVLMNAGKWITSGGKVLTITK